MSEEFKYIWDGIYTNFAEAPQADDVFESAPWLDKQANRIADMRNDSTIISKTSSYALTPVLAMMAEHHSPVRVLDFGGSLGTEYLAAQRSIPVKDSVDFTIVENEAICSRGSELFSGDAVVRFLSDMPSTNKTFDLVHAGSSIQYVDDWRGLLKHFAAFSPQYIVLSEVLAGENPSFVTVQHWYGKSILARFLNMDELTSYMEDLGYKLILHQNYISASNGNGGPLPMENFPERYRVKYSSNMVLKRY